MVLTNSRKHITSTLRDFSASDHPSLKYYKILTTNTNFMVFVSISRYYIHYYLLTNKYQPLSLLLMRQASILTNFR